MSSVRLRPTLQTDIDFVLRLEADPDTAPSFTPGRLDGISTISARAARIFTLLTAR